MPHRPGSKSCCSCPRGAGAFSGRPRPAWIRSSTGSYIDDAGIAEMKNNGTYLVPTLYLGDWFLENAEKNHVPEFYCLAKAKAVMPVARKNVRARIRQRK